MQRKQVFCKDAQYRSILWAFPDFDFGDTDEKDDCFQEWVTHNFSITQKRPAINFVWVEILLIYIK